jgi:hypothetical protein
VEFDAARAVDEYRSIMARLEAATVPLAGGEYDRMAKIARARWTDLSGDDDLFEAAFGEPIE